MISEKSSEFLIDTGNRQTEREKDIFFESADYYSTFFHEDPVELETPRKSSLLYYITSLKKSITDFIFHTLKVDATSLLFLFILGLSISAVATFIDTVISLLFESREKITIKSQNHEFFFLNYLLWIGFSLFMSVLAASAGHIISSHASGSGIPEMKSIMSGAILREYLSFRTMCAKTLGIIATYASGFSVGRDGPFVHISACICRLLLSIPIFKSFKRSDFIRNQLLAAACAAGVSATFGAPFGGVLFSIEVTATFYPVGTLWKGVFTSLIGAFFFFVFRVIGITSKGTNLSLFSTDFEEIPDNIFEYALFALLSVICGFLGPLFVWVFTKFVSVRQNFSLIRGHRYLPVLIVSFLTAAISFPLPLLNGSPQAVTKTLFSKENISKDVPYLYLNLIISAVARFFITTMANVLPIPCGSFTPVFEIGGTVGRMYGELVNQFIVNTVPGGYAVVGAAAMASATTGTLSTAIILFELTGQLQYMLPVLLSTCIAVGVSNLFNLTIYDTILRLRGLPYLSLIERSDMQHKNFQNKTVQEVMRDCDDCYFTLDSNVKKIEKTLRESNQDIFPLVDNESSFILIGSIQRGNIEKMLVRYKKRKDLEQESLENEENIFSNGELSENNIKHDLDSTLNHLKEKNFKNFQDFNLSEPIIKAIEILNFESPTSIQSRSIPLILSNQDIIITSDSGNGKKTSLLISTLEKLLRNDSSQSIRAAFILPTYELANQFYLIAKKLIQFTKLNISLVASEEYDNQMNELSLNPEIVITIPEIFNQILNSEKISSTSLEILIIDEIDLIFKLGYKNDINNIIKSLPLQIQKLISAHMMIDKQDMLNIFGTKSPIHVTLDSLKVFDIHLIESNNQKTDPSNERIKFLIRSPSNGYDSNQEIEVLKSLEKAEVEGSKDDYHKYNNSLLDNSLDSINQNTYTSTTYQQNIDSNSYNNAESNSQSASKVTFNFTNISTLKEDEVQLYDDTPISVSQSKDSLLQNPTQDQKKPITKSRSRSYSQVVPRYMSDARSMHEESKKKENSDNLLLNIDPAPFQISIFTPMAKVYFLFSMLGLSQAFVVSRGKLIGVVLRKDLILKRRQ